VGKPIHGVEVKIADDGEILVRGENVTRGYYRPGSEAVEGFEDGWLHTGDIGGRDEDGRIYVRGRKKEMIVTPEGLNVFPEDVERELLAVAGVSDAAVVGRRFGSEERVHAVLVLAPGVDAEGVVATANLRLADHQRVRSVSTWPDGQLPRTEGTRKLRRREIKAWVDGGESHRAQAATSREPLEHLVLRYARGATAVSGQTPLEELGLSSLERVELLMALEERFQVTIDEGAYAAARTVEDLRALVETPPMPAHGGETSRERAEPVDFPAWNRSWGARAVRRTSLPTWILPLARVFASLHVEGLEHLRDLPGPVVFASNHQSHMDTPAILAALPARWRYRVGVAMAKEFFKAHFFPGEFSRRQRFTNSLNYYLASLFFNAFPLPQREAGTRQTLRYIGTMLGEGYSVLIFPEGKRTRHGEIAPFRPGVGMIGARLGVPVVPVRLEGLDRVLHQTWRMARRGPVRVTFGAPLALEGDDYATLAARVEAAVRALGPDVP
jgi:long-chain acyl-CoA synthetase